MYVGLEAPAPTFLVMSSRQVEIEDWVLKGCKGQACRWDLGVVFIEWDRYFYGWNLWKFSREEFLDNRTRIETANLVFSRCWGLMWQLCV